MKSPAIRRSFSDPTPFRRHLMAAAAATLFALPQIAPAATITFGGACTLTGAINSANSDTAQGGCPAGNGADIIVLPAAATLTVNTATLPSISSEITIQGNGSTLQRGGTAPAFRLLTITGTGNLTVNDLTIANGQDASGSGGGGIRSEGRLVLNRSTVTGSSSTGAGGGIAVVNGSFELNDSTVSANYSARYGGGVYTGADSALITTTIRNSTITGNTSGNFGGGLSMEANGDGVRQTIDRSTISGNTSGTAGGGIFSDDSLTITNSTISGNTASLYGGGGISHRRGALILQGTTVADNRAVLYGGGGIATRFADMTLINSTVSGNLAGEYGRGGGIVHYGGGNYSDEGSLRLKYSTVSGNSVQGDGGGIYSQAPVSLSDSQVTGNTAANGGGGINTDGVALVVEYSSVSNNVALNGSGGGLYVESDGASAPGSLTLTNSTVAGNRAGDSAGIALSFDATAGIQNSTISGNTARTGGGGLGLFNRASAAIGSSTITGNLAQGIGSTFGDGAAIAMAATGVLTLQGNIIAGNEAPTASAGKEIRLQAGFSTLINNGFNVLGSATITSAQAFSSFTPVASDRTATSNGTHPTAIGDILGAGLADNGGPTLTFNTRGAGPARDFIPSSMCTGQTDQRGVVRPKNGQGGASANECDAGAVESAGFNAVDLSISKTSNGPVFVGQPLTFSLTLRNDGPEPANGIEVFDTLPAGLEFVSASRSDGFPGACGETSGTVECRLLRLGPAQEVRFDLLTRTTAVGPVTNTASFINDTLINTNAAGTDFDAEVTTQVLGPTVTLSVTPASIAEAAGVATLRATLSQAAPIAVTVNLSYTGTAGAGDSTRPASITIPAGATSATASITATQDTLDEDNETVIASISSVPNGMIGSPSSATVTITDDDATPTVSFTLPEQAVGEGTSRAVTAQLSAVSGRTVTVLINFAGTASNPADYGPSATSIVIPAGAASGSLTLTVVDDTLDEPSETVVMSFGTLVNATPGATTTQTVTITDNDNAPTVTLAASPLSIAEAAGVSTLTATLSAASGLPVTVNLAYSGTAGAGDSTRPASIAIPAGSLSGTTTITATQDTLDEDDETVIASIGSAPNATIGTPNATTITITDDDAAPTVAFSVATQTVGEDAGTVTVRMNSSALSGQEISVPLTFGGTAGNPADYSPNGATITIPAGTNTGAITLTLNDDALDEADETVIVTPGTPVNANLGTPGSQTVTLTDNDSTPTVSFLVSSDSVGEAAGARSLTVQLSVASADPVRVPFSVSGTASAADYTGLSASPLVIPAGMLGGSIQFTVVNDSLAEPDEQLLFTLGTPVGASLGAVSKSLLTIRDNDTPPADTVPNAFDFVDRRGVKARTDIISNTITVGGLSAGTSTAVTLNNGSGGDASYSINGAAFRKTAATVRNGDTVRLRNRIPGNTGTANASLTIGGVSDAWKISTSR